MELHLIAFTERGFQLAQKLGKTFGGTAVRCGAGVKLKDWAGQHFGADALVFVGAAGIAVRAIAPYIKSKTSDPAVVVVDENGRWAIPILSGHLGGANELALRIAKSMGAEAVITTATDGRSAFAADTWAKAQGLLVLNAEKIKCVSAAILAGQTVLTKSRWPVAGALPKGVQWAEKEHDAMLWIDIQPPPNPAALWLCPPLYLGLGCRKNAPQAALEASFAASGLPAAAVRGAGSIDIKKEEPGLLAFCHAHGWEPAFYSAALLAAVPGEFTASAFVKKTVGVDNVCERAALLTAGEGAALVLPKQAGGGVTLGAAMRPLNLQWSEDAEHE